MKKSLPLDLSRFHKVAEDKDTSTFQHHDAPHTITVAHKALPRHMRTYLKNIPIYEESVERARETEGDKEKSGPHEYVQSNPTYKRELVQAMQKKNYRIGPGGEPPRKNYAPGGGVNASDYENADEYANAATGLDPNTSRGQAISDYETNKAKTAQETDAQMPRPGESFADVAPRREEEAKDAADAKAEEATAENVPRGTPMSETPPEQNRTLGSPNPPESIPPPSLGAATQAQGEPSPFAISPSMQGGLQHSIQGLVAETAAQQKIAKDNLAIEQKNLADQQAVYGDAEKNMQGYMHEFNNIYQDVKNGHVDPNKYWDNHDRFATGMGIVLAGFNPTGNPNGAIEFLKSNIDRDTKAQIANMENKQSALGHYAKHFGDIKDAATFISAGKTLQAAQELKVAAAKQANPLLAAKLLQDAGKLETETGQKLQPMAMKQAVYQAMANGQPLNGLSMLLQPEDRKSVEEKTIPGVGYALNRPVPTTVIENLTAKNNLIDQAQKIKAFYQAHTTGGVFNVPTNPLEYNRINKEAETMMGEFKQTYRQAFGASTSENEDKQISAITGDHPTSFLAGQNVVTKLDTLSDLAKGAKNNTIKSWDITPFSGNGQATSTQEAPTTQRPPEPKNAVPAGKQRLWSPKKNMWMLVDKKAA